MKKLLARVLYIVTAIMIILMVYSMIKGPGNYYYGAIAIVIAVLAKAAEKLDA